MKRFLTRKVAVIAAFVVAVGALGGGSAVAAGGDDEAAEQPITGSTLEEAKAAALAHTGEGTVSDTEDEESSYEVEVTLANGDQVDVQLDKGFKVVGSENDGANGEAAEQPITGSTLEEAKAAALAHTGEGTVSDTEDEGSSYEVEVTLANGDQVDVQLDNGFKVVSSENDGANDED